MRRKRRKKGQASLTAFILLLRFHT